MSEFASVKQRWLTITILIRNLNFRHLCNIVSRMQFWDLSHAENSACTMQLAFLTCICLYLFILGQENSWIWIWFDLTKRFKQPEELAGILFACDLSHMGLEL